jgi:hypothetical protein
MDPKEVIWSMAFESLSADRLDRDHRRMVSKLYGNPSITESPEPQFE